MDESPPAIRTTRRAASRPAVWVWAAVLTGLVLRLGFALGYWVGKPLTLDEQEYLLLGRSLAEGRGYTYDAPGDPSATGSHFAERAPAYPAFVAAVLVSSGPTTAARVDAGVPAAVKVAQSVLGACAVWLIAIMAWRAAGPTSGVAAAWLSAVYPPLVWISAYLLSETLYVVLALAVVWWLGEAIDRERPASSWPALAAGVAAGVGLLTREAMAVFLILAVPWLAWRRRWRTAALLLAGALVVAVPWMARNAAVHGRFVVNPAHGGVTFWTGNHPLAGGEGDMAANPALKRAQLDLVARHPGLTMQELDAVYTREALEYIRRHPLAWAWLLARKAFYTIVPIGPSYRLHSTRYFVTSAVSFAAVLVLAAAALPRQRRLRCPPRALWLMAASAVAVSIVFFPQERFRIPVLDPTAIVCAAALWSRAPRPAPVPECAP